MHVLIIGAYGSAGVSAVEELVDADDVEQLTLVVDAEDGTVLGYQGLHYHADVMAKTMQVVVEFELDVREVPDRAFHPTTPEIIDGLLREASKRLE